MIGIVITAIAFGIFAFAGVLIGRTYFGGEPIADGPPVGEPPVNVLVAAAAIVGGICAYRGMPPEALGIVAASCALMTAIWYTDVTRGIVPDSLTLIPLGALIVGGLLSGGLHRRSTGYSAGSAYPRYRRNAAYGCGRVRQFIRWACVPRSMSFCLTPIALLCGCVQMFRRIASGCRIAERDP
jgi:hypothetical protein